MGDVIDPPQKAIEPLSSQDPWNMGDTTKHTDFAAFIHQSRQRYELAPHTFQASIINIETVINQVHIAGSRMCLIYARDCGRR
jgi:hypothetical protein